MPPNTNDEEDEEEEEEEGEESLVFTDSSCQQRAKLIKTMAKHELVFVRLTDYFVSVLMISKL